MQPSLIILRHFTLACIHLHVWLIANAEGVFVFFVFIINTKQLHNQSVSTLNFTNTFQEFATRISVVIQTESGRN
jgi:hypothetical protein